MLSHAEPKPFRCSPDLPGRLAGFAAMLALGLTLGACSGGGGGGGGSEPGGTTGNIEVRSLWPQADSLPIGAFGTTLPAAVESTRYVFRASSGYRCCVVIDPDELTGNRAITLRSLPAGPGTLQVSGHPTSLAGAPDDVTEICNIDPDIGRPCIRNEPSSPSFDTGARAIDVVAGRTTDAGDVQVRAVPFVMLPSLAPAYNVSVNSPIAIGFTVADAIYGVDPDSVTAALIPLGGSRRNLTVVLRACNDGTAVPCSPNGQFSARGFISEADSTQAVPSRPTKIEISARNLAPVPSVMVFEYGFTVVAREATATPSSTATPTPGTPTVRTNTPVTTRSVTPTPTGTRTATFKEASVRFVRATSFRVSQKPSYLAVGDFNRDGRDDVAVTSPQSAEVRILLGNPDGSFTSGAIADSGTFPGWITTGDLNGDAFSDLAIADRDGGVSLMFGGADATFSAPSLRRVGQRPYGVAIGDFDGQTGNDLVITDHGANEVRILLSNGQPDPTFRSGGTAAVGMQPTDIVTADANGDGHPDVATLNTGDASVILLLYDRIENGSVVFNRGADLVVGDRPSYLSGAELNRDGRLDLVMLDRPRNDGAGELISLLSRPDGSLAPSDPLALHCPDGTGICHPLALTVGDFDNDGVSDIAVALNQIGQGLEGDVVRVFLGSGDGGFSPGPTLSTDDDPLAMATGDFNGDGLTDVVVTSAQADSVQVYVNVSVPD